MNRKNMYLLWEAEMKASILGAAMVAQRSKVPTPKPAISLAVIFSIRLIFSVVRLVH